MSNLLVSMILLLTFNFSKLSLVTIGSSLFSTHTFIMFYIFIVDFVHISLHVFFLCALFFKKISPLPGLKFLEKKLTAPLINQSMLIFFMIYALQYTGNIAPWGLFHTNEITIFNNTALCDHYPFLNCIKGENSVTIYGTITIQYLNHNEKLLTFYYFDKMSDKNDKLVLRLNHPQLTWVDKTCYTSRFFMNTISPHFR